MTIEHWRLRKERYSMIGESCPHCQTKIFPPRDICPSCGQGAREPYQFSGKGEVYSFTTVRNAPAGFEGQAPYVVALVKLNEGPMVTTQITDLDPNKDLDGQVQIGMEVEMVTRKLRSEGKRGTLVYGYKFRPVSQDTRMPEPVPDLELTSAR